MTPRLRVHLDASAEIETAAKWYEEHRKGLGREFVDELSHALDRVASAPQTGAVIDGVGPALDVRRRSTRRFPYQVVYLTTPSDIVVLAIAHERRRPDYWFGRLPGH